MKTLQEFYTEILASDELKKRLKEAVQNGTILDFAKDNGVETTDKEILSFLEEKEKPGKELSPEELEQASGGIWAEAEILWNTVKCKLGSHDWEWKQERVFAYGHWYPGYYMIRVCKRCGMTNTDERRPVPD